MGTPSRSPDRLAAVLLGVILLGGVALIVLIATMAVHALRARPMPAVEVPDVSTLDAGHEQLVPASAPISPAHSPPPPTPEVAPPAPTPEVAAEEAGDPAPSASVTPPLQSARPLPSAGPRKPRAVPPKHEAPESPYDGPLPPPSADPYG